MPDNQVAYLGEVGSGYAQSNFLANCTSCGKKIKKDLLGLHKFANDIVRITEFLPYVHLQPSTSMR